MTHFADRLLDRIEATGTSLCVGVDPVYQRLPRELQALEPVEAIRRFGREVLEIASGHVPCVKLQSACFERYGPDGVALYFELIEEASDRGLLAIADAKRGDIGTSAGHYAAAFLGDDRGPDAVTINSYFGKDGIVPFVETAAGRGRGVFALVRTSNPSGDAIQGSRAGERTAAEMVADVVAETGRDPGLVGSRGYSLLGAVVAATKPTEIGRLRARMPQQLFLVPGLGAQGGRPEDLRPCFHRDGTGAVVTASRSITEPWQGPAPQDWRGTIAEAVAATKRRIDGTGPRKKGSAGRS